MTAQKNTKSDLTREIKSAGLNAGADLVGIAGAAELRERAPGHDPDRLLAGARCAVLACAADPPGILSADGNEEYSALAMSVYMRADAALLAMRRLLMSRGYRTRVIERSSLTERDRRGLPVKVFPLKSAAQAAGMGVKGWNQLLITPEFGPRARFSGMLTDAPLEHGTPLEESLCNGCGACVAACPSGAIGEGGEYNLGRCAAYLFSGLHTGELKSAFTNPNPGILRANAERLSESASGWMRTILAQRGFYYNCGACVKKCMPIRRAASK